jgi:diacylglycerol O-acyltransferase
MSYSFCEPLSAVDAAFLAVEDSRAHMHIGAVTIFEARELLRPQGGLDIERIRAFVGNQLHRVPRFRQKLAFVPLSGRPVWIDDASFNLTYHVRHTALPLPGDAQKLKDLAGRIMSQELERAKPLWELWFVEGLEGERFAVISKIHHALADGISGLDLMAAIVGPNPDYHPEPTPAWIPRAVPSGTEMLSGEVARRFSAPLHLLFGGDAATRDAAGVAGAGSAGATGPARSSRATRAARSTDPTAASPTPDGSVADVENDEMAARPSSSGVTAASARGWLSDTMATLRKTAAAAAAAIEAPVPTPLNVDVGPYRRFDWTRVDLRTIAAIRQRFGDGAAKAVKVNDVVLTVVAGAVRRFLLHRGVRPEGLDFRAMVPVSVRADAERGDLGNRVTQMLTRLPVEEADPVRRLRCVVEITTALKRSGLASGGETMAALAELLSAPLVATAARIVARRSLGNMIVTNVPGPPMRTYLLGAPSVEAYPLVPLGPNQDLNVAVLSYDGVLHWGFNADWDAVPDLADFVALVDAEIEALTKAAAPRKSRRRAQKTRQSALPKTTPSPH